MFRCNQDLLSTHWHERACWQGIQRRSSALLPGQLTGGQRHWSCQSGFPPVSHHLHLDRTTKRLGSLLLLPGQSTRGPTSTCLAGCHGDPAVPLFTVQVTTLASALTLRLTTDLLGRWRALQDGWRDDYSCQEPCYKCSAAMGLPWILTLWSNPEQNTWYSHSLPEKQSLSKADNKSNKQTTTYEITRWIFN